MRYDNLLLALPMLEKHQRRNKDGGTINTLNPEQGDRWTSLENELHHWIRELDQQDVKGHKKYCVSSITRIKNQLRKSG